MDLDIKKTPVEWEEAAEELSALKDKMIALAKKCKANISIQGSDYYDGFWITIYNLAEQGHAGKEKYLSYGLKSYNGENEVRKHLSEYNVKE
jgi:hypothetical protein